MSEYNDMMVDLYQEHNLLPKKEINNIGKTLRQFSMVGPCLTFMFGKIVRETDKSWFFEVHGGTVKRVKKTTLYHVDPCHSCRDHAETDYPYGYMD